jgi:hypothetical protein
MRRAPRARTALISDLHLETDLREIRRAADKCIGRINDLFVWREADLACLDLADRPSIRPETPHGASFQARIPRTAWVAALLFSECRQRGRPSPWPRRWRRSLEVIVGNPFSATAPARAAPSRVGASIVPASGLSHRGVRGSS